MEFLIIWYASLLGLLITVKAQSCFQAVGNNGDLPEFRRRSGSADNVRIFHRHQAIIASYRFQCCGNVTAWGAEVEDAHDNRYDIAFQVWRPSPRVEIDGCYSMIGQNTFTRVSLEDSLIRETPAVNDRISFQPNDVVGFYFYSNINPEEDGVVLDRTYDTEAVWHGIIGDEVASDPSCPIPVGTQPDRLLRTSTNLAPVISLSYTSFDCPLMTSTAQYSPASSVSVVASPTLSPSPTPPRAISLLPLQPTSSSMTAISPSITQTPEIIEDSLSPTQTLSMIEMPLNPTQASTFIDVSPIPTLSVTSMARLMMRGNELSMLSTTLSSSTLSVDQTISNSPPIVPDQPISIGLIIGVVMIPVSLLTILIVIIIAFGCFVIKDSRKTDHYERKQIKKEAYKHRGHRASPVSPCMTCTGVEGRMEYDEVDCFQMPDVLEAQSPKYDNTLVTTHSNEEYVNAMPIEMKMNKNQAYGHNYVSCQSGQK